MFGLLHEHGTLIDTGGYRHVRGRVHMHAYGRVWKRVRRPLYRSVDRPVIDMSIMSIMIAVLPVCVRADGRKRMKNMKKTMPTISTGSETRCEEQDGRSRSEALIRAHADRYAYIREDMCRDMCTAAKRLAVSCTGTCARPSVDQAQCIAEPKQHSSTSRARARAPGGMGNGGVGPFTKHERFRTRSRRLARHHRRTHLNQGILIQRRSKCCIDCAILSIVLVVIDCISNTHILKTW